MGFYMLFSHLETYTVSFFGHRYIDNFRLAEERLTEIIKDIILEKEYVEFLVGRDGDFDQIVSSTIRRVKRDYGEHNSAHVCILPYMTAEFRNNEGSFYEYYDEVEVADTTHPKSAFQTRNRMMIDRSDLVIFYIDHESGGAWQTYQYATKKEKNIINIAKESEEI